MNTTRLANVRKQIDLSGDSNLIELNLLSDIELDRFLTVFNEAKLPNKKDGNNDV